MTLNKTAKRPSLGLFALLLPLPLAAQDLGSLPAVQLPVPVVEAATVLPTLPQALPAVDAAVSSATAASLPPTAAAGEVVNEVTGQVQGVANGLPGTAAVPGAALSPGNPLDAVLQDIVGVADVVGPRVPAMQVPADEADLSIADRIVLGRCVMMSVDGMQVQFDGVPANEATASHAREHLVSVLCPAGRNFSLSTLPVTQPAADASRYKVTLRPYEAPETQQPALVWAKVNGVPVAEYQMTADGTEQIITVSFQIEDAQQPGMTPAKPGEIIETESLNRLYLVEHTQRDVLAGQSPALAAGLPR